MPNTYKKISEYVYDCNSCSTRCDGISKGVYSFKNDADFSEKYENLLINKINKTGKNIASKCQKKGYPDIEIKDKKTDEAVSFLEIKVQRRTFMSVQKYLNKSNLFPSETLALNLSDLLRYFRIKKEIHKPISILWILFDRPCIVNPGRELFFYQTLDILEKIYNKCGDKRRFRRKSGKGDVVDGSHKGVVVNYHFSLKELKNKNNGFIVN